MIAMRPGNPFPTLKPPHPLRGGRRELTLPLALALAFASLLVGGCQTGAEERPSSAQARQTDSSPERPTWPVVELWRGSETGERSASLKNRLDRPIELRYADVPLQRVLREFGDRLGVEMHVNWAALESAGIAPTTRVSYVSPRREPEAEALAGVLRAASPEAGPSLAYGQVDRSICVSVEQTRPARLGASASQPIAAAPPLVAESIGSDSEPTTREQARAESSGKSGRTFFEEAELELTESSPQVHRLLSRAALLYVKGRNERARGLVLEALKLDPDHSAANAIRRFLLSDPPTGLARAEQRQ